MKDMANQPEKVTTHKCPKCNTNPFNIKHASGWCTSCFNTYQRERYHRLLIEGNKKNGDTSEMIRYKQYKNNARIKKRTFDITYEQFVAIIEYPCVYCGTTDEVRGMDRLDSDIGYVQENVVSCCKTCNYAKRNMTHEKFEAWLDRIAKYREIF